MIRTFAIKTANDLNRAGRRNESQFMFTLTDLLACYSALAVYGIAAREKPRSEGALLEIFARVRNGFLSERGNGDAGDPEELALQIARWISTEDFKYLCGAYAGVDLPGLGFTREESDECRLSSTSDMDEKRFMALVARCCKHASENNTLPQTPSLLASYANMIGPSMRGCLNAVLQVLERKV